MPIQAKASNRAITDDSGYVSATLADITETSYQSEDSDNEREQLLFDFLIEGTKKQINLKLWTGQAISSDKNWVRSKNGKPEYSKLTQLCLSLGLFSESDLKKDDSKIAEKLGEKLESLKGKTVKFKLLKTKTGLNSIDFSTIKIAE
jgi:hypothetical protein